MRILNRYILEGAPMFIPLSPSCREEILSSKASSALIFGRARQEVMTRLGGGEVTYCVSDSTVGWCFHDPNPASPIHFLLSFKISCNIHTYIHAIHAIHAYIKRIYAYTYIHKLHSDNRNKIY